MNAYYEAYWADPELQGAHHDPDTPRRLRLAEAWLPPGGRVLDYGCGSGRTTAGLLAQGRTVVATDVSQRALALAAEAAPAAHIVPFSSVKDAAPFDGIYSAEVIEHVYDVDTLAAEWAAWLKPGGWLFVTTPYHGWLKNVAIAAMAFDSHFAVTGPHIRFFTRRALTALLAAHGLTVRRVGYYGRMPGVWSGMAVWAVKQDI